MDNPIFEPHFSAEHLARKIDYLKAKIGEMPKISKIKRGANDYIRVVDPRSPNMTFEKKADSPEGNRLIALNSEKAHLISLLKDAEEQWRKLYKTPVPDNIPNICRVLPIPECLSLSYYNNPPEAENPYTVKSSYVFEGKILRSRFEYIGVQAIKSLGLEFKNEIPVFTPDGTYFLDIVIPVPERGRCVGFEFCGKINDPKYINSTRNKLTDYIGIGLVPWHDIIFIFGGETWIPPAEEIQRAVIFGIENC